MFLQWDGNRDGFITPEEAKPMENVKCTAQYIDKCGKEWGKLTLEIWNIWALRIPEYRNIRLGKHKKLKNQQKKQIPDDMVVDGKISLDEWCDCFSFADGDRHEPPCHKAKHAVDPHLQG